MNRVRVRTTATTATAGNAVCVLWNPHATLTLVVYEVTLFATTAPAAGSTVVVQRVTARGGPSTSVTQTIANDCAGGAAPSSGATLDTQYGTQPTPQPSSVTNALWGFMLPSVAGSGFVQPFPEGIRVQAGMGLGILAGANVIVPVCEAAFAYDE